MDAPHSDNLRHMQGTVTIVGYGSLMSAYGLARERALPKASIARVELSNAARRFGKPSIHAKRLAVTLDAIDPTRPMTATRCTPSAAGTEPQAVAVTLPLEYLPTLAKREGYPSEAARRLIETAGDDLADWLADLFDGSSDVAGYRAALFERIGVTSPHYIPQPIRIDGEPAIVFVAPGAEGTGSDEVRPIRADNDYALLTTAEVWRATPTQPQLDYIASCLLAGAHGVAVDDLAADLPVDLRRALAAYAAHFSDEPKRLREILGLGDRDYAEFRGPRLVSFCGDPG